MSEAGSGLVWLILLGQFPRRLYLVNARAVPTGVKAPRFALSGLAEAFERA
ncbi:MAG: hypothetical protein ABI268_09285 [Rhodanobacter sp.]